MNEALNWNDTEESYGTLGKGRTNGRISSWIGLFPSPSSSCENREILFPESGVLLLSLFEYEL